MRVPLLDSLNYNILDVSTLPLHNSLQTPLEVPGNQQENARILWKRVENIGDIFSQSRNRCHSVCVALVLCIDLEKIVQKNEIGAVRLPAPVTLFLSGKWFEMTHFLKWVSTKSKVRSAMCALAPSCWNQNLKYFFHRRELGEGLFFQYLPINQIINIFLDENRIIILQKYRYLKGNWYLISINTFDNCKVLKLWFL